ncbi:MAG: rRNA methylase, partial [Pelotomaculum thermopropionicum]
MTGRPSPRTSYLRRMKRNRRFREREGKFLVEGIRFVEEALSSDWPVETLWYCSRILESPRGRVLLENAAAGGVQPFRVAEKEINEMADTETPQGVIAVVRKRAFGLNVIWET